jgi:hypothetical protein
MQIAHLEKWQENFFEFANIATPEELDPTGITPYWVYAL